MVDLGILFLVDLVCSVGGSSMNCICTVVNSLKISCNACLSLGVSGIF